MDVDGKQREIKRHGTFELPMEYYDCNNRVYKDLYMHWHKEMEIIYVICGEITVRLNDRGVEGAAGDFIFIAPETVHYIKSGDELLRFKSFVFSPRILCGCADDFCQNEVAEPLISRQLKISDKITTQEKNYKQIKEAFFALVDCLEQQGPFYQMKAKYLLIEFFYGLLSGGHYSQVSLSTDKVSTAVRDALDYIGSNYSSEITARSVSDYVHYNEYYFMRVFKKYTGRTLVEYITELRLDKSKELLLREGCTVEEAAMRVGFSSTSYFTSKFRETFKATPSEFRRAAQKQHKA